MTSIKNNHSLYIFFEFLRRDFYVYFKRIHTYALNFIILYPVVFIICFGYLQAKAYFSTGNVTQSTIFFAGNIILLIMSLTFEITILLLFDLENERTIDYRRTILDPKLVLLEQILFTTLFTFCMIVPFFPMAKILLQNNLDTTTTSWPLLYLILFFSCLCCSAYHLFVTCALKNSKQIVHFWMRGNWPLLSLGGFWVPWHIMNNYSSVIGTITLLNPLLYATEGIRQAIVNENRFFSIYFCAFGLLFFSILFTLGSFYLFKKKVDHI